VQEKLVVIVEPVGWGDASAEREHRGAGSDSGSGSEPEVLDLIQPALAQFAAFVRRVDPKAGTLDVGSATDWGHTTRARRR
jgi:hypothetical protein